MNIGHRITSFLFLFISIISFASQAKANHYELTYDGKSYDNVADTTTFTYTVSGTGLSPALSHFVVGMPLCQPPISIIDTSPSSGKLGSDPTSNLYGIKWDFGIGVNDSQTYSFSVAGNVAESKVIVAIKAGLEVDYIETIGASCGSGTPQCPNQGQIPPHVEICDNTIDDDCDGRVDEVKCEQAFLINGGVYFEGTGEPIKDAFITATSGLSSITTDASGHYEFTDVISGSYSLMVSKEGYVLVSQNFENPIQIAGSDRTDNNFFLACAEGFVFEQGTCNLVEDSIRISASDGTSTEHVELRWSTDACAVTYLLFRSTEEDKVFSSPLLINGTQLAIDGEFQTLFDTSATPAVIYYYGVLAIDTEGEICEQSNIDPGFRLGDDPFSDCDGDGISDEQELKDGTIPCDGGSNHSTLHSPVFAKWNTFLSQWNFLELVANGTTTVQAEITVFDINGQAIDTRELSILPGNQIDVDINQMAAQIDTYGLVRVKWNEQDEGATLIGRLTNYRPNRDGQTFSFAFAKELVNANTGATYALGNSFDPQGQGLLVPNWTEIQNIGDTPQRFTYNLYGQNGQIVETYDTVVPALGERDLNAGHENGEGAYLVEVIPHDGSAKYLMTVSRYSSNHNSGAEADSYNFAFAGAGRRGTGDKLFAQISNKSDGCYTEANWVEVANTKRETVTTSVVFRSGDGTILSQTSISVPPLSQIHLNASSLLPFGTNGTVEVETGTFGSLIMQSLVYLHDCFDNSTQTAFVLSGQIAGPKHQTGSYNRYLGMENILSLSNVSTTGSVSVTVNAQESIASLAQFVIDVPSLSEVEFDINSDSRFATSPDTYGTVTINSTETRQTISAIRRVRRNPLSPDRIDFVIPTSLY